MNSRTPLSQTAMYLYNIDILSYFSELFESMVHPILARLFDNLLVTIQHGFSGALSVQTNLINFVIDLDEMAEVNKENETDDHLHRFQ